MKILHTTGKRDITELDYDLPKMQNNQIKIKTVMCGVCRSDVAAYAGWENPMPLGQQGHEGLGIVMEVGKEVNKKVSVGDYVSTWSDPAYGDFYYANEKEFVVVPSLDKKYILQPTACAINIVAKTIHYGKGIATPLLIIGSGFMSLIIGQYLNHFKIPYIVAGSSHKEQWKKLNVNLTTVNELVEQERKFEWIIDLSSKAENFYLIAEKLGALEALICYAATPFTKVETNFFESCWNCHTFIMPSPRNKDFPYKMEFTKDLIVSGIIDPSEFWTCEYKRSDYNSVKKAFEDGVNRPKDYLRGYIKW
jgi:threonine dehydrogenase-like Zn-dependent dehydrogenase